MATTPVRIPQLNSNDTDCYVDRILARSGDAIQLGQTLFLMQTSKAAVDVEAEASGYFVAAVQAPCKMKIGDTLGWVCETSVEAEKLKIQVKTNSSNDSKPSLTTSPAFATSALKNAEISNLTTSSEAIHSSLTVRFSGQKLLEKTEQENWPVRTLLPLILFELEKLLPKYPRFTAYFASERIHFAEKPQIGLGIDLGSGLRVYNLSLGKRLSIENVQAEILEAVLKEKRQKWSSKDFQPVNFIVTDLTGQDILHFLPVLSQHQGACLAIGADKNLEGQPYHLTVAFDHRVLSGREVALFLSELKLNVLGHERTT